MELGGEDVAPYLLARWKTMTTNVREEAATALVQGQGRMKLLTEEYLKGEVSFTSEEGAGTCFTVTLPLRLPEPQTA